MKTRYSNPVPVRTHQDKWLLIKSIRCLITRNGSQSKQWNCITTKKWPSDFASNFTSYFILVYDCPTSHFAFISLWSQLDFLGLKSTKVSWKLWTGRFWQMLLEATPEGVRELHLRIGSYLSTVNLRSDGQPGIFQWISQYPLVRIHGHIWLGS